MQNRKQLASLIAGGVASSEQLAEAGRDLVHAVKMDQAVSQTRMTSSPAIEKAGSDDGRTLSFIASTEGVDRMGDIIRVKGWDLANYRKNPIILFQHNSDWPIGTAKIYKGELPGGKKALLSDITFASAEASPMAEQVYQLAKAKVLRGNSVGFFPRETRVPKDEKERTALGLGEFGVVFERSELIEDSVVSVPANPEAVQLGLRDLVRRSLLTQEQADLFVHDALGKQPADWFDNARRSLFDFSEVGEQLSAIFADAEQDGDDTYDDSDDEFQVEPLSFSDPVGDLLSSVEGSEKGYTWRFEAAGSSFDASTFPFTLTSLPSAQADSALATALTALVATQAEQLEATRALADTLHDLARKVLTLNVASTSKSGAGDEDGDEEGFDTRSVKDALRRLTEALAPK